MNREELKKYIQSKRDENDYIATDEIIYLVEKEKCEHDCKKDTIKKNKLLHDMKSIAYLLELFKQEFDRFHEDLEDMTSGGE